MVGGQRSRETNPKMVVSGFSSWVCVGPVKRERPTLARVFEPEPFSSVGIFSLARRKGFVAPSFRAILCGADACLLVVFAFCLGFRLSGIVRTWDSVSC
jgi:hypothetical protein